MAEQEIIKHAEKAYKIVKSSGKDLKNKLIDIFIEILIIVFAVTISIWLSNWSESRHDRNEEREFLIGFKKDMQSDILYMTRSKEFYVNSLHGIKYFLKAGSGELLTKTVLINTLLSFLAVLTLTRTLAGMKV